MDGAGTTGGHADATMDVAIGATEVTGGADVLNAADMDLTAGIMAGTCRSAVHSSFPKC